MRFDTVQACRTAHGGCVGRHRSGAGDSV